MDNLINIFSSGEHSIFIYFMMLAASFLGGILASISPCSLAMLPIIIGYVGGCSDETPQRTLTQLVCFIFGTAIVFSVIGVICAITGSVFANAFGAYFTLLMASLLLVIGLKIVGIFDFDMPIIVKSIPKNKTQSVIIYPILLGMLFALVGTPCSTPILAGIMAFAAIGKNLPVAILMLFLFALGQGLILILAGFFTSSVKNLKKATNITELIMKISGILLIFVSLYLFYKAFKPLI